MNYNFIKTHHKRLHKELKNFKIEVWDKRKRGCPFSMHPLFPKSQILNFKKGVIQLLTDTIISLGDGYVYYPKLTKICGNVTSVIFLCNLLRWTGKQKDPEGWIYKTQSEIQEETGLSRKEQETARKTLKQLGFLEEQYKGIPRKLFYRLNLKAIDEAWEKYISSEENNNKNNNSSNNVSNNSNLLQKSITNETMEFSSIDEEPANPAKSILPFSDIIESNFCTCLNVQNGHTNTNITTSINSVCVNDSQEKDKMEEIDNELISKLAKHEIATNIIDRILHIPKEQKKNILKVIESLYFQQKVLNKTAFLLTCIKNNWNFNDLDNEQVAIKNSYSRKEKTEKKRLHEERDPETYLEMERVYKEYLRNNSNDDNEEEVLKFLGLNHA